MAFIISRRALVGAGFGLAAGSALAQQAAQPLLSATSEQALGPFFPVIRPLDQDNDLTHVKGDAGVATGEVIDVFGKVTDRAGRPVPRARIDLWQANAVGKYAHPGDTSDLPLDLHFQGSAVILADDMGNYRFRTIKPGAYNIGGGRKRTPHIHADVMGRAQRLITQMYFPGEPLNASDILFRTADPKESVVARAVGPVAADPKVTAFAWDIVLALG
jgi:protocatechuate 3,4-dioxygenase beta subunit